MLNIQCIRKVFTTSLVTHFVTLQPYSKNKWNSFFTSKLCTQCSIITRWKTKNMTWMSCKYSQPLFSTLLKHLWQQLQSQVFFSMKLQASTPIFEKFLPFFLQNRSSSNRLECRFTFKSLHSLSIGLKSGLWLGHSPKATPLLCRLCLGLLSCWKMNLLPPWGPDHSGYHQEWLCILIHSSFPRLVSQFLLHSVMQPPPCFTVAMVLARWWEVSGFPQTWHLASRPEWEFLTINL